MAQVKKTLGPMGSIEMMFTNTKLKILKIQAFEVCILCVHENLVAAIWLWCMLDHP